MNVKQKPAAQYLFCLKRKIYGYEKEDRKKNIGKKISKKENGAQKDCEENWPKKAAGKSKKNKLGVKNSLVNNINARKKKGTSRPKKKSTIDKDQYDQMQDNWGEKK